MKSLRAIFAEASEMLDAEQRRAFVAQACGEDAAARREVEELLAAHETVGGFLGDSKRAGAAAAAKLAEGEGDRIGRYKLLQKIGEGGCGVVYIAEQEEPVRRRVALKLIKLGMDTRSVIARFEAERQALALMDHPNIARVLDAGATDTGRPFFVMELVRGIRISDYCDQNGLSTPQRLKLFIQVCHAVQHAHQKGIIHRDLKPSNILVTSHDDGTPLPKVIDFGIAKATSNLQLTDKTLFTHFEMFIGTPAYMSPEQAEFNARDIDTRTDIYSLGVLLYELLTGHTPFDTQALLQSGLDAMRQTIREMPPVKPSTRLTQELMGRGPKVSEPVSGNVEIGDGLPSDSHSPTGSRTPSRAASRRDPTELQRLIHQLRGDLDWIVLKALEKDRTRRYGTANALAMDVQRCLDGEPILARPPSALYSFQKLVRRNKVAFGAAAAVVAALALGLALSTAAFLNERQARQRAAEAEKSQRRLRAEADSARQEADSRAEQHRLALVQFNIAAAAKLIDEGDAFSGLLRIVEALRLDGNDTARAEVHRRYFAAVLRSAPELLQFWRRTGGPASARFHPDGTRVVCGDESGATRVFDARTGEPALPPIVAPRPTVMAWFTPDGQWVATVDDQGQIQHWDAQTAAAIGALLPTRLVSQGGSASRSGIYFTDGVDYSADGRRLIAIVADGYQFFEVPSGEPTGDSHSAGAWVQGVRLSPDGRSAAIIGEDPALQLVEVPSGRRLWTVDRLRSPLRYVAFSPDGARVVTVQGKSPYGLDIWSVLDGNRLSPTVPLNAGPYDFQFSPDGNKMGFGTPWAAQLLDGRNGKPLLAAIPHSSHVHHLDFGPDSRRLITACSDRTSRVWDTANGQPLTPVLRHSAPSSEAHFCRDNTRFLTSAGDTTLDGTIHLWALRKNGGTRLQLPRLEAEVARLQFSTSGRRLLSCGVKGELQVCDTATRQIIPRRSRAAPVTSASLRPDGSLVAVASQDGTVRLWDLNQGGDTLLAEHKGAVNHVEFSADGQFLLLACDDFTARVWNVDTREPATRPFVHDGPVHYASFSPDAQRVVTASGEKLLRLWNVRTGLPDGPVLEAPGRIRKVVLSPDHRRLLSSIVSKGDRRVTLGLWDALTGQPIGPERLVIADGCDPHFSPDGRYFAGSVDEYSIALFDAESGARIGPRLVHEQLPVGLAFSPDSRLILTYARDRTARVWHAATSEPVTPPLRHPADVTSGVWSPDGREIVTGSSHGALTVWDVSPTLAALVNLQNQAELLAAHRLDPRIGPVPLTAAEMKARRQALRGK